MSRSAPADSARETSPENRLRPVSAGRRRLAPLMLAAGLCAALPNPGGQPRAQAQDQLVVDTVERTGPQLPSRPVVSPEELQERVLAAGAMLAEQGYRVRRDSWHGSLAPDARVRVPVFLFEGNDYRFIIATDGPLREVLMSIVDRDGALQPHRTEFGGPPSTRAISFAAQKTGLHYVQLGIIAEGGSHASCLGLTYR